MSDGPHPEPAGQHRFRTRDAVVVGAILAVGGMWFQNVAYEGERWLPAEVLILLTVALAVIFGASMSPGRGFVASAALAATVIGGGVLGVGPLEQLGGFGVLGVVLFVIGTLIVVPLAWLSGVVIGSLWRWTRRRWYTT